MTGTSFAELTAVLLPAFARAGAAIMRHYRAGTAVLLKGDRSPVTAADTEAEALIVATLARHWPSIPVIAEEQVAAGQVPPIHDRFFLVDPLDGTREFIAKRGEFTVNVALVEGAVPRFGIVYAPATGELCLTRAAGDAAEATFDPDMGEAGLKQLAWRPMRARTPAADGLVVLASRSHLDPETQALIARYPVKSLANAGSSLKFCALARGAADFYPRLGPTMEWDTAAGEAVLRAAGGSVTRVDGRPLDYGKRAEGFKNPGFLAWGRQPIPPR